MSLLLRSIFCFVFLVTFHFRNYAHNRNHSFFLLYFSALDFLNYLPCELSLTPIADSRHEILLYNTRRTIAYSHWYSLAFFCVNVWFRTSHQTNMILQHRKPKSIFFFFLNYIYIVLQLSKMPIQFENISIHLSVQRQIMYVRKLELWTHSLHYSFVCTSHSYYLYYRYYSITCFIPPTDCPFQSNW